jgi:hypothetical protein
MWMRLAPNQEVLTPIERDCVLNPKMVSGFAGFRNSEALILTPRPD